MKPDMVCIIYYLLHRMIQSMQTKKSTSYKSSKRDACHFSRNESRWTYKLASTCGVVVYYFEAALTGDSVDKGFNSIVIPLLASYYTISWPQLNIVV